MTATVPQPRVRTLYIDGDVRLTTAQKLEFKGWRISDADKFIKVEQDTSEALVIGDYPNIVAALKASGVVGFAYGATLA